MEAQLIPGTPIKPPKKVIYALGILVLSLYLSLAPGFACNYSGNSETDLNIFAMASVFVLYGVMWFYLYLLTKGAKWIRTLFLVLYCVGFPIVYIPVLYFYFSITPLAGFLSLFQTAVQLVGIVFLFSKESNQWYTAQTKIMQY